MDETIQGLAMLSIPLSAVMVILLKCRRDHRKTKKWLVLYDKNTKYWLIPFIPLFSIFIYCIWAVFINIESFPIKINSDSFKWNPWGWYT